ncbi:MAG: MBL fold metallo-hydrolase [Deltaproteobacteria bacterium]|jgi:L-ascorbate metabolism protein UlaG (beta-lactamase superfamily)|nr:MBL fold metallo-hydrolase [Deltaproteobacteria bacterium]
MSYALVFVTIGLMLSSCAILGQERFGRLPEGERLMRIQASPNYQDGQFKNTAPTIMLADGQSPVKILWKSLWADRTRTWPQKPLPAAKLDLKALDPTKDVVIWLGHFSFFIQLGGKRILMDPVFNDHAAPFSLFNKSFPGTDLYRAEDLPDVDFLLVSHDHWDHLDHQTVVGLMSKVKTAVAPLGVGAHFVHWGYPKEKVLEADWNTALRFDNGFVVHVVPARHFSGRLLTRNQSLWGGFVLETPTRRIYLSGDSGYGPHIRDIADAFDGFDLVAIDGGQYDARWPQMHMTPEEATQAARELKAKFMLLAHVGRFCISAHPWDEPFERATAAARDMPFQLLTPKIGEPLWLDAKEHNFSPWWRTVE